MIKTFLSIATASLLFFIANDGVAQAKFPAASSSQKVTQDLGIKKISLTYQRPGAKGRQVFGGLVPYGKVWRTGANNATTITFEEEVTVNGNKIPAGTYGLFTIPNEREWTIILNKGAEQWGSYNYKEADDLLRFQVTPQRLQDVVETFTIGFEDVTTESLNVSLAWENTKVKFPVKTDQSKEIIASIDQAMKGDKKPYFPAAQYYYNNDLDVKKAVEWVEAADKERTAPHVKYWKSRILLKSGDKAGAAKAAQEGIDMATKANNAEYIKLNTQALEATR